MELSRKMLEPSMVPAKTRKTDVDKYAPNKKGVRRIDMYFASTKRSKRKINDNWQVPELSLAELFENLPEAGHPVSLCTKRPYYLYGIFHRSDGTTPTTIMSKRRCIELCIDGKNTTIEFEDSKLFVVDHRNGLKYELLDSFRSKILPV